MTESPDKTDDNTAPTGKSPVLLLLGATADATWRMFIPTIGLLLLGVWLDSTFTTLPWLTFIGLGLGIVISALLIRKLYKKL